MIEQINLTTTQIGSLAENLIANELMIESNGRLSPFQPIADDDGIDILTYDKVTGNAIPIQIKARTNTLKKPGKNEKSNTVHFEVRKATYNQNRKAMLLCVLLHENMRKTERAWLLPLNKLPELTSEKTDKFVIRTNKQLSSGDKYKQFQCASMKDVTDRLIDTFDSNNGR